MDRPDAGVGIWARRLRDASIWPTEAPRGGRGFSAACVRSRLCAPALSNCGPQLLRAPSTMLRMVPLPRVPQGRINQADLPNRPVDQRPEQDAEIFAAMRYPDREDGKRWCSRDVLSARRRSCMSPRRRSRSPPPPQWGSVRRLGGEARRSESPHRLAALLPHRRNSSFSHAVREAADTAGKQIATLDERLRARLMPTTSGGLNLTDEWAGAESSALSRCRPHPSSFMKFRLRPWRSLRRST